MGSSSAREKFFKQINGVVDKIDKRKALCKAQKTQSLRLANRAREKGSFEDCAKHFKSGILIRREFQALKRFKIALHDMKEEGLNKKEEEFSEEFASLVAINEVLKLFEQIAKSPLSQLDLIQSYEDQQLSLIHI
eukprot:TRINITY_DN574_c0_g1_i2.p1 TRINITY_DN574_c0_g1~~TRINITY_DN574_c0_g1_i2.p1  ORF type:complete len:135 (-),score=35.34 TRINITY_DN574_c0_g1_i2:66-470(-)